MSSRSLNVISATISLSTIRCVVLFVKLLSIVLQNFRLLRLKLYKCIFLPSEIASTIALLAVSYHLISRLNLLLLLIALRLLFIITSQALAHNCTTLLLRASIDPLKFLL